MQQRKTVMFEKSYKTDTKRCQLNQPGKKPTTTKNIYSIRRRFRIE